MDPQSSLRRCHCAHIIKEDQEALRRTADSDLRQEGKSQGVPQLSTPEESPALQSRYKYLKRKQRSTAPVFHSIQEQLLNNQNL
jgi:hypothetical protein